MRRVVCFRTLAALAIAVGAGPLAAAPTPISPGAEDGLVRTESGCPTFLLAGADEATELVVYRADADRVGDEPVLRKNLPAGASGWTPSLGECLEPGGRYAWAVRASGSERGGGEWSEARVFEVSAAPSAADLERALAVLAAYSKGGGGNAEAAAPAGVGNDDEAARAAVERSASDAVAELLGESASAEAVGGGTTAIAGVVSDPTGQNVGVQGTVASGNLATGVLAQSTATSGIGFGVVATVASPAGAALVLGSDNGADLILTDSVFSVDDAGHVAGASFSGDGSGLTGVPVGNNTVTSAKIVDGTIIGADIEDQTIVGAKLVDRTVSAGDLRGKLDIYVNRATYSIPGQSCHDNMTVSCLGQLDVPLQGTCMEDSSQSFADFMILGDWTANWGSIAAAATYGCRMCNLMGNTQNFEVEIVCMSLVTPDTGGDRGVGRE